MPEAAAAEKKLWKHYNSLILSPDIERIRKLIARYELFKMSIDVPGHIIECGVFKGVGLMYWLKLLKIFSPKSNKKVIGFDTFKGYPPSIEPCDSPSVKEFIKKAGNSRTSVKEIRELTVAAGLKNKAELIMGDIRETANDYVEKKPNLRISLLNMDLDTYAGTKAALEIFYPLVSKRGVIIFDEYKQPGFGETTAVNEFFERKEAIKIKELPFSHNSMAYLIKK